MAEAVHQKAAAGDELVGGRGGRHAAWSRVPRLEATAAAAAVEWRQWRQALPRSSAPSCGPQSSSCGPGNVKEAPAGPLDHRLAARPERRRQLGGRCVAVM